jgi:hypothetical protein
MEASGDEDGSFVSFHVSFDRDLPGRAIAASSREVAAMFQEHAFDIHRQQQSFIAMR